MFPSIETMVVGVVITTALAVVLQQPAALRQLRRRGAIIEPLWADLRERQRLTRFHRRGLASRTSNC